MSRINLSCMFVQIDILKVRMLFCKSHRCEVRMLVQAIEQTYHRKSLFVNQASQQILHALSHQQARIFIDIRVRRHKWVILS